MSAAHAKGGGSGGRSAPGPRTVFEQRRQALRERLGDDAPAILVTGHSNVRYLTGFTGGSHEEPSGQLLLDSKPVFFTDGRYEEQSANEVPDLERVIVSRRTKFGELLLGYLSDRGLSTVAVEAAHLTVASWERLKGSLDGVEMIPTNDVVENVRVVKDSGEIDAIRRAQSIAETALESALRAWAGGTEAELALAIEWEVRTLGAEAASFDVIVAGGSHSALPHASPRRVRLEDGGILLIDMGARADGYCSDMTRTYLGPGAPAEMVRVHAAVCAALEAGCAAVRPGIKGEDVDRAARECLEAEGLAEHFLHSTGHGVGLDVHEPPSLAMGSEDVLEPGMVVTVEPGVYLPGVGGVRVEDLLVVTEDGAENLTKLDRGSRRPDG